KNLLFRGHQDAAQFSVPPTVSLTELVTSNAVGHAKKRRHMVTCSLFDTCHESTCYFWILPFHSGTSFDRGVAGSSSTDAALRRFSAPIFLALVALGTARIVATYSVYGHTYDEPDHIACGMEWLDRKVYQYEAQHPPL